MEDRGIIKGYKKLPNYNDERTAVYKHKLDKIIHVGIRGTALSSFDDLMNECMNEWMDEWIDELDG